ncbi:hypothetical protein BFP72_15970 [Reichenbachiella sp. 5M10]|uniref:helix-hairpin-helix domain-containing protein n=1 Tax=Reichenbachiella sp. 5M10 TaxID=1889772 RepID=UPI000C14E932|nr:helix-hairpin-helix domain-containing protein [Reichenbachiella sp. 5M10]PIB36791.1 hypothetical protein BFP72_15970 [Reichenbachiella sp. 5M10]
MEIRGLFVLIPVTLFMLFVPQLYKAYWLASHPTMDEEDARLLAEWKEQLRARISAEEEVLAMNTERFDPNHIDGAQWRDRGFKPKIAERIIRYRDKGGQFRQKEDVMKIYGIDTALVKAYFDYMVFPVREKPKAQWAEPSRPKGPTEEVYRKESKLREPQKREVYNLSTADTTQLQSIRGIGSYWSRSVVDYREKLGGFVDRMQVYEIYYMKDSVADLILTHTSFDPVPLRQINVNTATVDELAAHPYIRFKLAHAVVKYREQHGDYELLDDIKKIVILKEEEYSKIRPYLKISD